jgi:hypothetical protein
MGAPDCSDGLYRRPNDRFPSTEKSVQGGVCHRAEMKILALIGYARVLTEIADLERVIGRQQMELGPLGNAGGGIFFGEPCGGSGTHVSRPAGLA